MLTYLQAMCYLHTIYMVPLCTSITPTHHIRGAGSILAAYYLVSALHASAALPSPHPSRRGVGCGNYFLHRASHIRRTHKTITMTCGWGVAGLGHTLILTSLPSTYIWISWKDMIYIKYIHTTIVIWRKFGSGTSDNMDRWKSTAWKKLRHGES